MCPICKTPTVPPNTKLTVKEWASTSPLNNIILYLMETSVDTEDNDDLCLTCKTEDDTNIVEVECQEQLCKCCKRSHKGMKISIRHKIVPINEMQTHQQPDIQLNFIQDCTRHPGQRLELYCTDHRDLCCAVCFTSNHRECINIRDITDGADEQTQSSPYNNINKDVMKIQTELENLVTD